MAIDHDLSTGKCPVMGARRKRSAGHPTMRTGGRIQLNLKFLHPQSPLGRSYGQGLQTMLTHSKQASS